MAHMKPKWYAADGAEFETKEEAEAYEAVAEQEAEIRSFAGTMVGTDLSDKAATAQRTRITSIIKAWEAHKRIPARSAPEPVEAPARPEFSAQASAQ